VKELSRIVFFLLVVLSLASCGKRANVQFFYVGENVSQYYIRSTEMKSDNNKMEIDITFRIGDTTDAICNYTIFKDYRKNSSRLDSIFFEIDGKKLVKFGKTSILIREIQNGKLRFTSKVDDDEFEKVLLSDKIKLVTYWKNGREDFIPSEEFYAVLRDVRMNLNEQ